MTVLIDAWQFLVRVRRTLTWEAWAIIAALVVLTGVASYSYYQGMGEGAAKQRIEEQRQERAAATAKEVSAAERAHDVKANQTVLDKRNDDARATPDTTPDTRTLRRRCRQLREAGITDIPECG